MKATKGCFGYLKIQRKKEIIKTILFFALSAAIFLMGYFSTGGKTNLLTVVAVLGCLPASKSMVSMIMYLKAGLCSQECYEKLMPYTEGTRMLYDLYLTSYQKNFQISAMAVKNNVVCGYTEDAKCDVLAAEKHIASILSQNGYDNLTVKIFSDLEKFKERLFQLQKTAEKKEEKEEAVATVLLDVSL